MTSPHSRKAVVIGGAGFLGERLVACLLGQLEGSRAEDAAAPAAPEGWPQYDSVHVLDTVPFVSRTRLPTDVQLTHAVGDIRNRDDLRRAFAGAHTVFHLASIVDVGLKPNPLIDAVNVQGTRNVIEVCQELGVPQLVYTSSEDVVLGTEGVVLGDESIPYPEVPMHDYVRTKIEGEKLVRAANGQRGLSTCCLRPVHLYGPYDPHAIKISLKELGGGKVPFLLGDGSARFDIVYVDNVAHAHLLAAAALEDPTKRERVGGEAYFIGEGNAPNYFEFIRPYAEARGIQMPTRRISAGLLSLVARGMELAHRVLGVDVPFHRFHLYVLTRDFFFSNEKAKRDLGYTPWVSPAEGQARTIEWIRHASLDD